jgi:DNA-binding SARP family transcriptional activator
MQFDVLGPLRVVGAHGTQVAMSSVAQRRLMSILVSRAGTVVSADSLAEHLELSPGALRTSVSRLRRVVGFDVLVTAPPGYELRSDNIDALRFEQLAADARAAADPVVTRAALEEALALWRGEAYDEFAY